MSCCAHCEDAGDLFNREKAQNELRKYRKSGLPNKSTRLLIDALKTSRTGRCWTWAAGWA